MTMFVLGMQRAMRACVSLAVCTLAAATAAAQVSSPRITQNVDDSSRITLQNGVAPLLRVATDQGAVADYTPVEQMRLILSRTQAQETALDTYLAQLQQKSSPNYHKWLTPAQLGERYGAAESDITTLTQWLESEGFTGISVSKARTAITFSGTAGTVKTAFHTSIHSFTVNGKQFTSNTTNPSIPSALASVVSGIAHLNSKGPRPFSHSGLPGQIDEATKRLVPLSNSGDSLSGSVHSDITLKDSSSNYYLYLVPGDAATIYNTPNSYNANFSTGSSYTGSGVTIGIIGDAAVSTTPVGNYRTKFLGESSPSLPTITNYPVTASTSDADEAYLDLEISGGLAPGATIRFYTGTDGSLATQIDAALSDNVVDILSVSFGLCEQDMTTSDNSGYTSLWQQAAAQGIPVTVSTGDSGSAGCDSTSTSSGANVTTATGGLAVSGLASTPYNIAVGGTDFQLDQSNFTTYASTTNSASTYYRTALQYIPEKVWNDSTQTNTTVSADTPWTTASSQNIVGGSGGHSSCSTNTTTSTTVGTCTSGHAKPAWQVTGSTYDTDGVRDIPDVSFMSGVDYYSAWLVCTNDTYSTYTLDCGSNTGGYYDGFGGTSAAAPAFAGMLALVQQSQGGGRLGQAAVNIYNIHNNSASASSIFHDVTVGNNAVPCTSGTTNCTKNTAGYYFESGYDSATGYDLASGLGSVNASLLISNWSSGTGSAAATVTATPSAAAITTAQSVAIAVTVTGSSNTPTGTVSLSGGGYTSSAVNLDSGTASIVIPAGSLATGADTLTISYSGDGVYSANTGTTAVTVTSSSLTATTTTLTPSATTATYNTTINLVASVSPTAATGKVYFYDSSTLIGSATLSSGSATLTPSTLSVGTHTLTAKYVGDSTYAASTSAAATVTITSSSSSGSASFTVAATSVTVKQGSSGTSTITVTPSGGYTGTVTISPTASNVSVTLCYTSATASVTGTSAVTSTLTIDTVLSDCGASAATGGKVKKLAVSGGKLQTSQSRPFGLGTATLSLAGLFIGLLGLRQRRFRLFLSMLVLAGIGLAMTACGGGSSSSSSSSSYTAKGTYTITVTGTDTSSNTATSTFTLTVD
jgi:hypothetical protein